MAKRVRQLNFDASSIRRYAEEEFSTERMVRGYVDLYKEALAQSKVQEAA
jgi:hypothetical protein